MRFSRGRYSTADPNNWGSRYGAYSQTLDRVNGDLAGQRLTNGLEFLSRMAQGAALPGSVDYTAPLTWYDSAEGTGAQKLIDGGGRLLYDAAASAADDAIRRTVTMGLTGMPRPGLVSPEVWEKMPQVASSLMAASNTYADNYAAYSADGTPIAQARSLAAVDSALEAVSEFLPFERLLKIPDITPETVSDTVKEVILSSVKEIPEELASSIGSTLADILIRRDGSDFVRTMNEAKAEGRTGGQALGYALGQEGLDLLREAAVTFLSGNLSGSATVGAKTLMHSQADPASSLTAPQGTAADPGSSQKAADPTGQTAPAAPGAQNQTQAPGTKPGSGVSNFWTTYMDAVRSYFFPPNAGTQTGIQTETQTGQNAMQTQIPGAAQPGMQSQIQGTMQPDGQPQTQGTAQPNFQPQVPGEGQPNAQAQTEKGQPLSPEKRIADLATDIKKSGMTAGKATIAAQEMVTEAEKRFGANSDAVLDAYQPGQNPRQFLNGFQNAYILGTQGNQAALEKSKAAAYLTQEQRNAAFELGKQLSGGNQSTVIREISGSTAKESSFLRTPGGNGEKAIPYSERGIEIEPRLMQYLENLHKDGDYISRKKGEVQYRDLAILTTETGAEYTSVTIGEDTYLIRGDSLCTTIPQEMLDLIISQQGSIDCHSHPFIGDLIPSEADMKMMEKLTWMNESTIIDPTQRVAKYNKNGLISIDEEYDSRDENYYLNMIWGEE